MPLSTRISPAAQRTIRDAFHDLERTVAEKDRAEFAGTTLDNVVKAAHAIEDQLAARQLLRNMRRLTPLFTGLQYYAKSIEVVCNGTPYIAWIWAPIKLILKIASDFVDAFEKIITAYARIAEPLARFKLLGQTYSTNVEVQQTLAIFYSDILKFHKEAYKFVRRSGWNVFFMTSWGRFQRRFDNIIDDLKAHEDLVDKTANAVGLSESRMMREELAALRREMFERAAREEEERLAAQYMAIVGRLKMDDSEQARISESVMTEPQKYTETCDWILQQKRIAAWMRCSQESAFLVLHGNPGTGKTVLAARIAAFLRLSGKSLVVSHICTYSQATSTEYDQILRSILVQLVRLDTDLVAYIYEEFILRKKSVTAQAIERLIMDTVGAISNNPAETKYVHIVLDGLDECEKDKQLKILNLLERMVSAALASTTAVCKVLVTSHMPASVAKKLQQKHVISLSSEKTALRKAIALYSTRRLGALRPRWHQMGITDVQLGDLEARLAEKADGMFLWARLVLEYLITNMFVRMSEVMEVVDTLPRKLSDFYAQMFTQLISHFDNRSVSRLQLILGWIAFAKRPLRKAELRSALSFLQGEDNVHVIELAPSYLFDMCAPLIEERADSTFAFVHVSVKEFLQSSDNKLRLDERRAAYEQGLAIASCLLSGLEVFRPTYPDQARLLRVLRGFHGLHVYASEFWVEYLLSIAASDDGLDTESKFYALSTQLATELNKPHALPDPMRPSLSPMPDARTLEGRLTCLKGHTELFNAMRSILLEQATRAERETGVPRTEDPGSTLCGVSGLPSLLFNYQKTVRALLELWRFPGVSIQELEKFKQDFRSMAFTCRVLACPHASTGFENEYIRDKHEQSHAPRIPCDVPGCQYPPFTSTQALKSHKIRKHSQAMPTIKIRPPRSLHANAAASKFPDSSAYRAKQQDICENHAVPASASDPGVSTLTAQFSPATPNATPETVVSPAAVIGAVQPPTQSIYEERRSLDRPAENSESGGSQEASYADNQVLYTSGPIASEEDQKNFGVEPTAPLDEQELIRYEKWIGKGEKLVGKSNALLHVLQSHLEHIFNRNKNCFDIRYDRHRWLVEGTARRLGVHEKYCICRRTEANRMIQCELCHEWYHGGCIKLRLEEFKEEDKYTCPVCDWRVKIPRGAPRPQLEDLVLWREESSTLPFKLEEEKILLDKIIENAQAFRAHIAPYCDPLLVTMHQPETLRFYLRKILGARILLVNEWNILRQGLHRLSPVTTEPPPLLEYHRLLP